MTPLEMIKEWKRGCSCAPKETPEDCKDCTVGLISAIENSLVNGNENHCDRNENSLLPCPFCGGDVELYNKTCIEFTDQEPDDIFDVRCKTKHCYLEDGADWFEEKAKVVLMWNTRNYQHV